MPDLKPIAVKIKEADAILIGASNGLSITEGLHLFADNAAFERLFGDFKRKYGNVWCTGKSLYQATDIVGNLITDIHLMLTNGDEKDMTFLYRVK